MLIDSILVSFWVSLCIVMSTSVCVCVYLSVRENISGTTRAIFTKFLCMLPMAVSRPSSSRVTKSQGEGAILGFGGFPH